MQASFDLVGRVVVQAKDETGRAIASSWRGLGRPHRDSVGSMITLHAVPTRWGCNHAHETHETRSGKDFT